MMRRLALAALALVLWCSGALAQSNPGLSFGQVPTPAQWNSYFAAKQDYLGAPPLLTTGGTMTGKLTTAASTSALAGFGLPPGSAPTSPTNGDLWTTTAGLFARINGATVGPFTSTATPCPTCAVTNATNIFTAAQTINLNAAALPGAQTGTIIQAGQLDGVTARMELDSFAAASRFTCVRADGTNSSPTTLQNGDEICSINSFGYNGTDVVGPMAAVRTYANQNWSVGANGTYLDIATTPNGSTTLTQVCAFGLAGGVACPGTASGGDKGVGTLNLGTALYIQGTNLLGGTPLFSGVPSFSGGPYFTGLPAIVFNQTSPAARYILSETNNVSRWALVVGDGTAESGANAGTNFQLEAYSDSGSFLQSVLTITRSSGFAKFGSGISVGSGTFWADNLGTTIYTTDGGTNNISGSNPAGRALVVQNILAAAPGTYNGPAAIFGFTSYGPTTNSSDNPSAIYGDLQFNAPYTFTGDGGALKGNAYTIAQLSAVAATAGSNNVVGDVLTISGGTCNTELNVPPQFRVTSINGSGGVTGLLFLGGLGACTVYPTNPVSVTSSNGGATPPTLTLSNASMNVTYLTGVYGRARHQAVGTVTYASSFIADGCYDTGGGVITNCAGVLIVPPYDSNATNSYGLLLNGAFATASIGASSGSLLSIVSSGANITLNAGSNYITHQSATMIGSSASPKSELDVNGGVAIGAYAGATAAPSNGLIVSGNAGFGPANLNWPFTVRYTATPGFVAAVLNQNNSSGDNVMFVGGGPTSGNPSGTAVTMISFQNGNAGSSVGSVTWGTDGVIHYSSSSDRRMKTNIRAMAHGLWQVWQLAAIDYEAIGGSDTASGFAAQELYRVYPQAVTRGDDDGTGELKAGARPWSVDYGRMTPLLARAVQQLLVIVAVLSALVLILALWIGARDRRAIGRGLYLITVRGPVRLVRGAGRRFVTEGRTP
jgi:hypothetical protein